jgi:hypothetical protein
LSSVAAGPSFAGPITKQNGQKPAFDAFTSICAVPGYANYGLCGGDATRFTGIKGKMNAVQPKQGRYNLDFTFTGLTPGVEDLVVVGAVPRRQCERDDRLGGRLALSEASRRPRRPHARSPRRCARRPRPSS